MTNTRRVVGVILEAWGGIRLIVDLLESISATKEFAKSAYVQIVGAPTSTALTVIVLVVGAVLLLFEPVKKLWFREPANTHSHEEAQPSSPEIFGTVEFAALRIGDLGNDLVKVSPDWATWSANLGVFIKARVNNRGPARTIPGFVIRLTAPNGETREARSERSIGKFAFHHYVEDRSGMYPTSRSVHEEMPDLVEELSTPLPPESHKDGWVHFEINNAAQDFQELSACRMEVLAEDIHGKRYEIEAAGVRFANLNAHEWVTAMRHG